MLSLWRSLVQLNIKIMTVNRVTNARPNEDKVWIPLCEGWRLERIEAMPVAVSLEIQIVLVEDLDDMHTLDYSEHNHRGETMYLLQAYI